MDDSQILALYGARNPDAIAQTSQKYGSYCFSIANNILQNDQDAEECVNDTWLRAWNAIPPSKPNRLSLFLARITRNLSFDRYHARTAYKRGGSELTLVLDELAECVPGQSDVAGEYEYKELVQHIRQFVRSLPERDCNVFLRRYFYTETAAEIARRYGMTENHVLVILNRTRKKLKIHLKKEALIYE